MPEETWVETAYERLLGRAATVAERDQLRRVQNALGLRDNDALWLVLYVGMFVAFQLRVSPKIRLAQVEECLERGACPVCLAALGAAQPAPDGCSACPKCGAAWRRP